MHTLALCKACRGVIPYVEYYVLQYYVVLAFILELNNTSGLTLILKVFCPGILSIHCLATGPRIRHDFEVTLFHT